MKRGLAAFGAVLLMTGLAACAPSPGATNAPVPARLDPDAGGPIDEWILFLGDGEQPIFLPTCAALILGTNPETKFRIVYSSEETRAALEAGLDRAGFRSPERLAWTPAEREVPWWARDQFLLGTTAAGRPVFFLHHPEHYMGISACAYGEGRATLDTVRRIAGDRARATRTRIEGGVIVADRDRAFVSERWLQFAEGARDFPSPQAYRRYLDDLYGLPVETLPAPFGEPGAHCDLYLMPIGDRRVILGDPDRGASLAQAATPTERASFFRAARDLLGGAGRSDSLRILEQLPLFPALVREGRRNEVRTAFRAMREHLENLGYEVLGIPWVKTGFEATGQAFTSTYTNVIMEDRGGERIVYLPQLEIASLDEAARRVWKQAGFRVVPIPALGPAIYGGGVRCMSHVLRAENR